MRTCIDCHNEKPDSAFPDRADRAPSAFCRACKKRRYQERDPERFKAQKDLQARRARLRKYGLTPETYDALLVKQSGLCVICQTEPPTHIDHCHSTGRVRGLLCHHCNVGIGHFRDDPERLRRAARYVS